MKTVFIVGVQRSGTTLLSVMLSKHPEILMESRAISFRIISAFKNAYDILPYNLGVDKAAFYSWLIRNDGKGRLAELLDHEHLDQNETLRTLIQRSIGLKLTKYHKTIWADKGPNLQHFLPDLLLLLPEARIIHIVRDGRATAISMANRAYQNLRLSAQQWVDGNVQGIVNQDLLGSTRHLTIKYENLVSEPEETLKSVCGFLEITYSDQMLNLEDELIPEGKKYVKSELDTTKISDFKGKLSMRQIRAIERIQGPLLTRLGYELLSDLKPGDYRPLSIWQRIVLHQAGNLRQLFMPERIGMVDRKNVELRMSFPKRAHHFLMKLTQDLLAKPIFKTLFRKVFYKEKYYDNRR